MALSVSDRHDARPRGSAAGYYCREAPINMETDSWKAGQVQEA